MSNFIVKKGNEFINWLINLSFIQAYSLGIIAWFTWGRIIALSNTDDAAREFLHNPFSFIIAIITVVYAIIVLKKKYSNSLKFITFTEILMIPHVYFMVFKAGDRYFTNHKPIDLGYLILDIAIVAYFIITLISCRQTIKDTKQLICCS